MIISPAWLRCNIFRCCILYYVILMLVCIYYFCDPNRLFFLVNYEFAGICNYILYYTVSHERISSKSKHTNLNSITYIRLCLEMYSCFVKSHYHSIYINGNFLLFLFKDDYVPFFLFLYLSFSICAFLRVLADFDRQSLLNVSTKIILVPAELWLF